MNDVAGADLKSQGTNTTNHRPSFLRPRTNLRSLCAAGYLDIHDREKDHPRNFYINFQSLLTCIWQLDDFRLNRQALVEIDCNPTAETWRRVWGTEIFFADQDF